MSKARKTSFNNNLAKTSFNKDIEVDHGINSRKFIVMENSQNKNAILNSRFKPTLKVLPIVTRIIVILGCLYGFIYQGKLLTVSYLDHDTIVKVTYETEEETVLPGITICFPFFSIWKQLEMKYPELGHYANESLNKVKELKKSKTREQVIKAWGHDDSILTIDGNKVSPFKLYDYFQDKAFEEKSFEEVFNMSVPLEFDSDGINKSTIYGHVRTTDKKFDNKKLNKEIIESFMNDHSNNFRKCFTLYGTTKLFQYVINFKRIKVTVNFNKEWFRKEFLKNDDFLFVVHKPNFIPLTSENSYIRLKPNKEYVIVFSRVRKHLLKLPYKTDCVDYDKFPVNWDHCIAACLDDYSTKECGYCEPRFNLQLKSFIKSKTIKLCNSTQENCGTPGWFKDSCAICQSQCKPDCYNEFYDYFLTTDKSINGNKNDSFDTLTIRVIHKTIPDVQIKHSPEFTWNSYVANMGGLAGMWLGLSVISAYDWFVILVKKVYAKFCK